MINLSFLHTICVMTNFSATKVLCNIDNVAAWLFPIILHFAFEALNIKLAPHSSMKGAQALILHQRGVELVRPLRLICRRLWMLKKSKGLTARSSPELMAWLAIALHCKQISLFLLCVSYVLCTRRISEDDEFSSVF